MIRNSVRACSRDGHGATTRLRVCWRVFESGLTATTAGARAAICLAVPRVEDHPRAPMKGEIGPDPIEENDNAVPKTDQPRDVNHEPEDPCEEARGLYGGDTCHSGGPADGREQPPVAIAEGAARLSPDLPANTPRRMAALLDRPRGHSGNPTVSIADRREGTRDEHLGMSRDRQIRFDEHPPAPVERGPEARAQRRCGDSSGPEDGSRGEGFASANFDPPPRRSG